MEYPSPPHSFFPWLTIWICLIPRCVHGEASPRAVAEGTQFKLQVQHTDMGNPRLAIQRSKNRLHLLHTLTSLPPPPLTFFSRLFSANGAYVTELSMGTPGMSFTAMVDTGSDLVWLQCLPCRLCYPQNATIFNPSASSTYRTAPCADPLCHALPQSLCNTSCQYTYSYGDQPSTSGDFSYDVITLTDINGTKHAIPNFAFGCGHDNHGSSFANAGGVLGMAQGPLSLISQLSITKFSYCLLSFTDNSSRASPLFLGNSVTISGYNIQSTPLLDNPALQRASYYYVGLRGLSVGGQLLNISAGALQVRRDGSGGTVLDSGTTLTFLVDAAYKPLVSVMRSSINLPRADGSEMGLDLCYGGRGEVPSLVYHLDGGDMALPLQNYFLPVGDLFCLGISKSTTHLSILGNMQQQNFHFLFDVASKKVSFAPTTCDKLL